MLEILRLDQQPGIGLRLVSASLAMSLLCLAACQIAPEHPPSAQLASRVPSREAIPEETVRYQILSDLSDVRFLVFRAGPFAKLGHNHVVQAKNIREECEAAPTDRRNGVGVKSACLRTFANRVSLSRYPSGIFTLTQRKHGWTKAQNSSPNRMTRRSRALPGTCSAKECWMPPNTRRSKLLRLP